MKQAGVFNMIVRRRPLKWSIFFLALAVAGVLSSARAWADNTKVDSKKETHKQTLTFEDELIEGSTQKPELFYLFQKKNFNYKRLIKLRENFIPEMKRNAEDIQKGRSPN
jgi:hypothetical protein